MIFKKLSITFLLFAFVESWEDKSQLTVQINDGKILGRYMTSKSGKPVKAFLRIPFAQPPVGDLRFKAPQKILSWNNVKPTQTDSPLCVQFNPFARDFKTVIGQEDCLFLNVYTPGRRNDSLKLPVIYWIHGGGWTRGEATNNVYSHQTMLDHDVILVSGNYRVGPLGFLSTEDQTVPGNVGFKDQNFILKWIQENIEHFGGDKNSVTIWGESAGGASVNYHMISPLSQGLFHRAISHSGSLNQCWSDPARPGAARAQAIKLANEVNCSTESNEVMVNCLRNIPAYNLTLAIVNLYFWDYDPVILFPPVVEDFESNEEKFIETRNYNETLVPWLTGMNSEEMLLKLAAILENSSFYNELMEKFNEILPYTFAYHDLDLNKQEEVTKALNTFYFKSETPSTRETKDLINLWTDGWFIGFTEALKLRFSKSNQQNTFVYLFTHKGSASYSATSQFSGTSHVDDLIPFFGSGKNIFISSIPTREDRELEKVLPELWVNFAKTGNPNSQSQSLDIPEWPVAFSFPLQFMQIGNENGKKSNNLFEVKSGFYTERADFWMELRSNFSLNTWV